MLRSEANRRKLFQHRSQLLRPTLQYSLCERNMNHSSKLLEVQRFKCFGAERTIVWVLCSSQCRRHSLHLTLQNITCCQRSLPHPHPPPPALLGFLLFLASSGNVRLLRAIESCSPSLLRVFGPFSLSASTPRHTLILFVLLLRWH